MKRMCITAGLLSAIWFLQTMLSFPIYAQEIAISRTWLDFHGTITWNDGTAVPPGTIISVFDPDNTLCGKYLVESEGVFGFLAVFGDDPLTSDTDEGAEEGDDLRFEINGSPANAAVPENTVWSSHFRSREIQLISTSTGLLTRQDRPVSFLLDQNYPNPFNPVTSIEYRLPKKSAVTIIIYNIIGQKVVVLVDEVKEAGWYTVKWDGRNDRGVPVASGIYLYRMKANGYQQLRKLVLSR